MHAVDNLQINILNNYYKTMKYVTMCFFLSRVLKVDYFKNYQELSFTTSIFLGQVI